MLPLFAYGTLRDTQYQCELFGRWYHMQPASVDDFVVLSTGGGYLAAVPRRGAVIHGALVELDAAGYAIADEWEDLTVYDRIAVTARAEGARQRDCFIYVQPGAAGTEVSDARLTDRPRAGVIADIRRFRAAAPFTHQP